MNMIKGVYESMRGMNLNLDLKEWQKVQSSTNYAISLYRKTSLFWQISVWPVIPDPGPVIPAEVAGRGHVQPVIPAPGPVIPAVHLEKRKGGQQLCPV